MVGSPLSKSLSMTGKDNITIIGDCTDGNNMLSLQLKTELL